MILRPSDICLSILANLRWISAISRDERSISRGSFVWSLLVFFTCNPCLASLGLGDLGQDREFAPDH
eukprot:127907-Prorocentrum_lima.AAC.1